ncbi:MAG: hypothetical protein CMJ18_24085 [Phycisphaeraceae bacterium]|nr:hypothetical protein [Phycisphaeraceae bacterium]
MAVMSPDSARCTLVLDVGKTNVKLVVVSKAGAIVDSVRMSNKSIDGPPYPHLDTEGTWRWMLEALCGLTPKYAIDAIVPTTHGCAAGLVGDGELVLPILDYEFDIPADTCARFTALKPPFEETATPDLPVGFTLGRQLFWLQEAFPQPFAKAEMLLTYPQYWSWRLSGVAAGELTSIACHSHLWNPHAGAFSSLVEQQGWGHLFPQVRPAYAALGTVRPEITERTGLAPDCRVHSGIHDSNAAYALYVRGYDRPFSLVSTGTWVIAFSPRLPLAKLDEPRDVIANVNVLGEPLPAGRYMGGREYEMLSEHVDAKSCDEGDLAAVIEKGSFLLPSYAPGGPFMGREGGAHGPEPRTPGEMLARLTLYLALMTETTCRILEMDGDLMIDGGFVNNVAYCRTLAALMKAERCFVNRQTEGTAVGAGMLAVWDDESVQWPLDLSPIDPVKIEGLDGYAQAWRSLSG